MNVHRYAEPVRRAPSLFWRIYAMAAVATFVYVLVMAMFGHAWAQWNVAPLLALVIATLAVNSREKRITWFEWLRAYNQMRITKAQMQLSTIVRVTGDNGEVLAENSFGAMYLAALFRDGRARRTFTGQHSITLDVIDRSMTDSTTERLAEIAGEAADNAHPPTGTGHPRPIH